MSDFRNALDYVHDALCELHEARVGLTASRASLDRLLAASEAGDPRVSETIGEPAAVLEAAPIERIRNEPKAGLPAAAPERPAAPPPRAVLPPLPLASVFPVGTSSAAVPVGQSKAERLAELREPIASCAKCAHLANSRTQTVFGVGNPDAELMFVGEAPGEDEDRQGEPFVGKAGQLLTKIIVAMGYQRSDVFIANVLKCRPDMPRGSTGNRKPTGKEMETCLPYLRQQIEIIQPRALVALGATAVEGLIGATSPMGQLRARWHDFQGIPLMATYHPAYLLRNQSLSEKRKVWEDMLMVLEKLGRSISEKQRQYFLPKE